MAITARRRTRAEEPSGAFRFLRETWEELRKVVWPTVPELYRYTLVVVLFVAILGAFIFAIDQLLQLGFAKFIYGKTG